MRKLFIIFQSLSPLLFDTIFDKKSKPLVLEVVSNERLSALAELARDQTDSLYYASLDVKTSKDHLELARKLFGQTRNAPYFVVYPAGSREVRERTRSIVSARVPSEELLEEVTDTLPKKIKYLHDGDVQQFVEKGVASNKAVITFLGAESYPLWLRILINDPRYEKLVAPAQMMHPSERGLQSFGVTKTPAIVFIYSVIGGEPSAIPKRASPHVSQYRGRFRYEDFRAALDDLLLEAQSETGTSDDDFEDLDGPKAPPPQEYFDEEEKRVFKITSQEAFTQNCGRGAVLPCVIAVLDGRKVRS